MVNDETMDKTERDEWLERLRRDGTGRGFAMRRLIRTCDGLDAKVAKATKMWTDDMQHAGKELGRVKSSNKRLREESETLRRDMGSIVENIQTMNRAVFASGIRVFKALEKEVVSWDDDGAEAWRKSCAVLDSMLEKYGEPDPEASDDRDEETSNGES